MTYKGMTVRQRSGGRWYARYKLDNGTYKYIYGKTQRECYDNLREFANSQSNAPKAKKKGVKLVTFGEFFDTWMKQEKEPNCREGTLRNFRSCHKHLKALDPKPLKNYGGRHPSASAGVSVPGSSRQVLQNACNDLSRGGSIRPCHRQYNGQGIALQDAESAPSEGFACSERGLRRRTLRFA